MSNDYAEYAVAPALRPYVRCVWSYTASAPAGSVDTVAPDGCAELIVHLGEPPAEIGERRETRQPPMVLAGQITGPLRLRQSASPSLLAVRFTPAGARAFTREPLWTLTDRWIDPADLGWRHLPTDALKSTGCAQRRADLLQRWLLTRLTERSPDLAVEACVAAIERGSWSMNGLMGMTDLSARQVERRFRAATGLSPQQFSGIARFRRLRDLPSSMSWAERAVMAGYYDQAQMVRDFRRFAGTTPAAFDRAASGLAAALA